MSDCCDPPPLPSEVTNPPPIVPPAPGGTILVLDKGVPSVRTTREETDAIGAMRRGLREYLAQLSKDVAGARVRFLEVFEEWAESEDDNVRYPAAAVLLADGSVMFDASNFTPRIIDGDLLPDGRAIVKMSEATTDLIVEAHCSSPGERLSISMLLEDGLNPVDYMYGFALDLPHYFGQRAEFSLESGELVDDANTARHGLRPIRMRVSARISVVRPRRYATANPQYTIAVAEPGETFPATSGFPTISRGNV